MRPTLLYLSMIADVPSHRRKLAGIVRYCAVRGWQAVPVPRAESTPDAVPGLLRRFRPVGCVVEGVGRHADLPPGLFRGVPVSYIAYPRSMAGRHPNFHFDSEVIVETALRELSLGKPSCYAAIGHPRPWSWSLFRARIFRKQVRAAGAKCFSFPSRPVAEDEPWDDFVRRLSPWLARLPEHCAVFAVSDETAALVARAARAAARHIPKSLTLLSVDNFAELCESATPPISSIELDFEREGYLAARSVEEALPVRPIERLGPLLVARRKSTGGRGRHEPWVSDAVEAIRREATSGLTAAALIARYPVSKRLFTMRYREATGHSVLDDILHVRLEKACALLADTDTAIGAIPGLCGFCCDRTLDALFRSRFGVSMLAWRRKHARAALGRHEK